jgi:hypothetical protein
MKMAKCNTKAVMEYVVITSKGKVYTFFLRSVAELYAVAYNGTLVVNGEAIEKETENA